MQKLTLLLCLVLFAAHQIQAECEHDLEKLCSQRVQGTLPYDCDKSCKQFIVCFTMNDKHMGILKRCPSGQYYDSSHKMCSIKKPAYCT